MILMSPLWYMNKYADTGHKRLMILLILCHHDDTCMQAQDLRC